jgi:hypothetical protein
VQPACRPLAPQIHGEEAMSTRAGVIAIAAIAGSRDRDRAAAPPAVRLCYSPSSCVPFSV